MTNIKTASSVSIDCPAITRSFMRLTIKEIFRSIACSHPPGKSASSTRGNSGYRKTDMASRATPSATRAAYSAEPLSIASWISSPAESRAAIMAKEMTPAPPIAKATGKPVMIPAKSVRKTMIRPTSTPSNPKGIPKCPLSLYRCATSIFECYVEPEWIACSRSSAVSPVVSRSRCLPALSSPSSHSR